MNHYLTRTMIPDPSDSQVQRTAVLFYPSDSLVRQIAAEVDRWHTFRSVSSFARSPSGMRRMLLRADLVLIDATERVKQAKAAFSRALTFCDLDAVAVYTEVMHPGLELFVRTCGALLLLGPLGRTHWHGLFEQKFGLEQPRISIRRAGHHRGNQQGEPSESRVGLPSEKQRSASPRRRIPGVRTR
jgi:hypothetical protein